MIHLVTGLPGHGKTLYAINAVQSLFPNRAIYYNGIKDLKLPWIEMPDVKEWPTQLPDGAVLVIDECQTVFRPRTIGATVPPYVAMLETHRHRGLDMVFITQDAMLMDVNVRRLVGIHFHVVRAWGLARATVHEWQGIKEGAGKPSARGDSIRHKFAYPKKTFALYKSAEIHTVKQRVPMRVFVFFLIPFLIAAAVWSFVRYKEKTFDKPTIAGVNGVPMPGGAAAGAPAPKKSALEDIKDYVHDRTPRLAGLPHTAPVFDGITAPVVAPVPAACVSWHGKGCRCYTQQGTLIADSPAALCEQIVSSGYFVSWKQDEKVATAAIERPQQAPAPQPRVMPQDFRAVAGAVQAWHPRGIDVGDHSTAKQASGSNQVTAEGSQPQPSAIRNGSVWAFPQ